MKKKLFGSLLCIGLVSITLMGTWRRKKPPTQTVSRLRISGAGALQSLYDQSGRELLGGGNHAMREGYVLRYQTRQGERLVYAVGNQLSGLTGQKTMPATGVAEALRRAQLKAIAAGSQPFYWAPFVLVGRSD
jgi:hypothetical protein